MTDDQDVTTSENAPDSAQPEVGATTGSAASNPEWEQVKRSFDQLGDSMGQWLDAIRNDPERKRHFEEARERVEKLGADVGKRIDDMTGTDLMHDLGDAAGRAGEAVVDAVKTVGRETSPVIANAFRTMADGMRAVAEKVDSGVSHGVKSEASCASAPAETPAEAAPVATTESADEPKTEV